MTQLVSPVCGEAEELSWLETTALGVSTLTWLSNLWQHLGNTLQRVVLATTGGIRWNTNLILEFAQFLPEWGWDCEHWKYPCSLSTPSLRFLAKTINQKWLLPPSAINPGGTISKQTYGITTVRGSGETEKWWGLTFCRGHRWDDWVNSGLAGRHPEVSAALRKPQPASQGPLAQSCPRESPHLAELGRH